VGGAGWRNGDPLVQVERLLRLRGRRLSPSRALFRARPLRPGCSTGLIFEPLRERFLLCIHLREGHSTSQPGEGIDRQRCRAARQVPGTADEPADVAQIPRQHHSFKGDQPIRRPQSHDVRASTASAQPPRHTQIPIARHRLTSTSRGFLPWRLSDDGPRRKLQRLVGAVIRNPSQDRTHALQKGLGARLQMNVIAVFFQSAPPFHQGAL
jgi:hypothetical protein